MDKCEYCGYKGDVKGHKLYSPDCKCEHLWGSKLCYECLRAHKNIHSGKHDNPASTYKEGYIDYRCKHDSDKCVCDPKLIALMSHYKDNPHGTTEKCFACGRIIPSHTEKLVDTRDGQKVFVGPDCFKKIGPSGYQPPEGGPRLYPLSRKDNPRRGFLREHIWGRRKPRPIKMEIRPTRRGVEMRELDNPVSPGFHKNVIFFRDNAGYVVGERLVGAIALARAEREAKDKGWYVEWMPDPDPDLSWASEEEKKNIQEVLVAVLRDEHGKSLQSLSGIVDPDRNYRRVVEAELAQAELK